MKRIALTPTTAKMPISHAINKRNENTDPQHHHTSAPASKMPRIMISSSTTAATPRPTGRPASTTFQHRSTAASTTATAAAAATAAADEHLKQTLAVCLEEVVKAELVNSALQNRLHQQDELIRALQLEVSKQREVQQENSQVHATNLKLQAKVLVLEKTCGDQELVLVDMQKKYTVLEGYYNELLEFVEKEQ